MDMIQWFFYQNKNWRKFQVDLILELFNEKKNKRACGLF